MAEALDYLLEACHYHLQIGWSFRPNRLMGLSAWISCLG